ncbi:VWA domain-containing protein, partial [Escherichia coli]
MSEKISLKKRQENLAFSLKKNKNLNEGKIVLRVACALDISGSMHGLYSSGVVSDFVGKLLPFGMLFDDNEQIDM